MKLQRGRGGIYNIRILIFVLISKYHLLIYSQSGFRLDMCDIRALAITKSLENRDVTAYIYSGTTLLHLLLYTGLLPTSLFVTPTTSYTCKAGTTPDALLDIKVTGVVDVTAETVDEAVSKYGKIV